jgi:C-terminal processing protease CtpA/Prc
MRSFQVFAIALAFLSCWTAGAGCRVHLLKTPPQHRLRLQKVMQAANRGSVSEAKRQLEDMLYEGEAKPWQDTSLVSDVLPQWLADVKVTTEQLERAVGSEMSSLPRLGGLGLRLRDDWKVTGMESDGPAAECGDIHVGDFLHGVDGISIQHMDIEEAAPLLFGENNSQVRFFVCSHSSFFCRYILH